MIKGFFVIFLVLAAFFSNQQFHKHPIYVGGHNRPPTINQPPPEQGKPVAPYNVFTLDSDNYTMFPSMAEALFYARRINPSFIYHWDSGRLLWDNMSTPPASAKLEAPFIYQLPELPRGCEVTSLAMLLLGQDIKTDKMELAKRVKKDPTPYQIKNGRVFYGNPNIGFVGQMYDIKAAGYGVYHGPIAILLDEYMPGMALDLTGCNFDDLFYYLALEIPVWVIVNATNAPLPKSSFMTWDTVLGSIEVTYREHAVLLTGYDETNVYFNCPLKGQISADKHNFAAAWEQMGRQAVTIKP